MNGSYKNSKQEGKKNFQNCSDQNSNERSSEFKKEYFYPLNQIFDSKDKILKLRSALMWVRRDSFFRRNLNFVNLFLNVGTTTNRDFTNKF
ncbi:hypothetical protein LEP1GSC188_0215 [Leptospira weilii serovar Topaz str. LT2116]|uniref:Uncharacterized protein n=1 Tax=Leptospira weilii serovar Topaz str. LT2116 TaxID=1088540 RepID=M3EN65_9LEPT|nr:hypothetical protein LEP1GSC188_0215 [Leptospira weilii serovar Topaz str. LT2116]